MLVLQASGGNDHVDRNMPAPPVPEIAAVGASMVRYWDLSIHFLELGRL